MSAKSPKPLGFSKTIGAPQYARPLHGPIGFLPVAGPKGLPGRPRAAYLADLIGLESSAIWREVRKLSAEHTPWRPSRPALAA